MLQPICITKGVEKEGKVVGLAVLDVMQVKEPGMYNTGLTNVATITRINVPIVGRKQGIGTYLMTKLIEIADRENMNLELEATPYMDSELSVADLIKFYEKFGFVSDKSEKRIMYRECCQNVVTVV